MGQSCITPNAVAPDRAEGTGFLVCAESGAQPLALSLLAAAAWEVGQVGTVSQI